MGAACPPPPAPVIAAARSVAGAEAEKRMEKTSSSVLAAFTSANACPVAVTPVATGLVGFFSKTFYDDVLFL